MIEGIAPGTPDAPHQPLTVSDVRTQKPAGHGESANSLQVRVQLARALTGLLPSFVGNRLRMNLLRAAGLRIGRGTIMWGMPRIFGAANLSELLTIGEESGFNVNCLFEVEAPLTIGNHVGVGHDVMFLTRGYEEGSGRRRALRPKPAPIVIGDGAWVGARCVIMPGVTVGPGAVIGAGMVISKDVPANTLLMGTQKISLARWR